jgi:chemotaxis family two-component system sensor kinase Cph1
MCRMSDALDFDALVAGCADEAIHAPGAVQPHGALIGVDADGRIAVVSANSGAIVDIEPAALLGRQVSETLGPSFAATVLTAAVGDVIVVDGPVRSWAVVIRDADELRLVEVEPTPTAPLDASTPIHHALRAFYGASSAVTLVAHAAETVQELTGFDRVLIYRFDPEWNGEVVAEVLRPGHDQFLGLRFPASDIPPQARALYSRARVRLIPDAQGEPSALIARDAATAAALDLSEVSLRAVSPVHLRYLNNMGVAASMSIAIHDGARLWGLIACHHLTGPLRPSPQVRDAVDLVGRMTSTVLAARLEAESASAQAALFGRVTALVEGLGVESARDPSDALADSDASAALLGAEGFAIIDGSHIRTAGRCPPDHMIARLIEHARASDAKELRVEELRLIDQEWSAHVETAAGAAVVPVDAHSDRWLVWVRPEQRRVVRWGGDPHAKEEFMRADGRPALNPRASFQEYLQQVEARSVPWTDEQMGAARMLASRLAESYAGRARRNAEVASLIQRTVMLDEFPEMPGVNGAARYRPVAGDAVGGDWYDVFFASAGRVIVALGDVAGHGLDAAATMAQIRHALRAYIVREDTIAEAMSRLNELIMTLLPNDMATAVVVALDPRRRTAEFVNAGHLPPLILNADGARFIEEHHDFVIGARRGLRYTATRVALPRDSTLVIYTDGLIERRDRPLDTSLTELLRVAGSAAGESVAAICDQLLDHFSTYGDAGDDVTVVAVQFTEDETRLGSVDRDR